MSPPTPAEMDRRYRERLRQVIAERQHHEREVERLGEEERRLADALRDGGKP